MKSRGAARVLDPEEALRIAREAGLVVHSARPLNCETPIRALIGADATPSALFYVRNHFDVPALDAPTWRLQVGGMVRRPLALSLRDLHEMPPQSLVVTLECAGNGRSLLSPPVEGENWGLGAVSTAEWTGVPLVEVLELAGVRAGGVEAVFRGADSGPVGSRAGVRYERGMRLEEAMEAGALLAYAMNGEPLPGQHGHPLRLVVPGWYGMASVKWLTAIEVMAEAFGGYFQNEKYVYEWERDGHLTREPVRLQRVRALITEPGPDQVVVRGEVAVRGVAWSGAAPIDRVEVSAGGGSWQQARLLGEPGGHSWQRWELIAVADLPGRLRLRARAIDRSGRAQPLEPEWNRLGYGSNSVQEVSVRVR